MTHKPFLDYMQATLDGTITPDQRTKLTQHLAGCQACQSTWEALREVGRLFSGAALVQPRAGFTGRFKARLAQRRSSRRLMWGGFALGLGALGSAAAGLVVAAGVLTSAIRVVQQPATNAALFTGLSATALLVDGIFDALAITARVLAGWAADHPWIGLIGLLSLAVTGVWLYFMRRLIPEVGIR